MVFDASLEALKIQIQVKFPQKYTRTLPKDEIIATNHIRKVWCVGEALDPNLATNLQVKPLELLLFCEDKVLFSLLVHHGTHKAAKKCFRVIPINLTFMI